VFSSPTSSHLHQGGACLRLETLWHEPLHSPDKGAIL
jgi:hypothetical protein